MRCERKTALIVAWVFCLAALAGCGDPTPTPTPTPAVVGALSPSQSSSPSPSLAPVMPAGYDPSWTENQLAAVRVVDAYELLMDDYKAMRVGSESIDGELQMNTRPLERLAAEPALSSCIGQINSFLERGYLFGGGSEMVNHMVGMEEMTADGHRQLTILGCIDTSTSRLLNADTGEEIYVERPFVRMLYTYTLQWIDQANSWRIVLVRGGGSEC
jgi:hypothetical protein